VSDIAVRLGVYNSGGMADSDGETVLYCATSQLNNVDRDMAAFSEVSDYTRIYKYHRRTTMQVSDIVLKNNCLSVVVLLMHLARY